MTYLTVQMILLCSTCFFIGVFGMRLFFVNLQGELAEQAEAIQDELLIGGHSTNKSVEFIVVTNRGTFVTSVGAHTWYSIAERGAMVRTIVTDETLIEQLTPYYIRNELC